MLVCTTTKNSIHNGCRMSNSQWEEHHQIILGGSGMYEGLFNEPIYNGHHTQRNSIGVLLHLTVIGGITYTHVSNEVETNLMH